MNSSQIQFCPWCGNQLEKPSQFCPYCGHELDRSVRSQEGNAPNAGFGYTDQNTWNTSNLGVKARSPAFTPTAQQRPMKWFKFIIYVQLFLAALGYVVTAFSYFTGSVYNSLSISVRLAYTFYPGLQAADYIYALFLLVLAVASIVVRMRLAGYKKGAPTMYLWLVVLSALASLLYSVLFGAIINYWDMMPTEIVADIVMAIYFALNATYFSKRSDLFVN